MACRQNSCVRAKCPVHLLVILLSIGSGQVWADDEDGSTGRLSNRSFDALNGAREAIFDAEIIADNVAAVRRHAASLEVDARFEALASWVLPTNGRTRLRMTGEFTVTNASPPAFDERIHSDRRGAEIVSPAFDLVDVAQKVYQLEELEGRLRSGLDATSGNDRRRQLALLALILFKQKNVESAATVISELRELTARRPLQTRQDHWPELLVAWKGLQEATTTALMGPLIDGMYQRINATENPNHSAAMQAQLRALVFRMRRIAAGDLPASYHGDPGSKDWIVVPARSAVYRGAGRIESAWLRDNDNKIRHLGGHHDDYLLYRIPVTGNFEVTGEMAGHSLTQLYAAGVVISPGNQNSLWLGSLREMVKPTPFAPPFTFLDATNPFRVVFRQDTVDFSLNGRIVHQKKREEFDSPWLGVRCWWGNLGAVHRFQISGSPVIPEEVVLSESHDLAEWTPYCIEQINKAGATWNRRDAPDGTQIVGMHQPWHAGTLFESLLQYHRPLDSVGSVSYDFFYEEDGETMTHPSLDRLAFLLDKDGVRTHWVTDGPFDRTDVSPGNVDRQAGAEKLPLKSGAWNHVVVAVDADVATLSLNGEAIYECRLNSHNNRTFGLFHFAEQSEVRVRNVKMRGNWPLAIPSAGDQELADANVASLDLTQQKLPSGFQHDFGESGLPADLFTIAPPQTRPPETDEEGVYTSLTAKGGWATTKITAGLQLHGDFDVEARFERLRLGGDSSATIHLNVDLNDKDAHLLRMLRMYDNRQRDSVQAQYSRLHGAEHSYESGGLVPSEIHDGRLRLARRGESVFFLVAEGDSDCFRLIDQREISAAPTTSTGISLESTCHGNGSALVVWKDIRARAEKIMHFPAEEAVRRRGLFVLTLPDENGTRDDSTPQVRTLVKIPDGYRHMGSPNWSSDGKAVIYDLRKNPADYRSTEMMIVNIEGEPRPKSAGFGLMPSLSPDRKQMVFNAIGAGVTMASSDGTNPEVLAPRGWGTQWAPDGRHIAWLRRNNFIVMDLDDRQQREILSPEQTAKLGRLFWHFTWSWDSTKLAFKANNDKGEPIAAIADVNSTEGFRILHTGPIQEKVAWHPDGRSVAFMARKTPNEPTQIYVLDTTRDDPPKLLAGQPETWDIIDCDWAPDGKRLVLCAQPPAAGVEWQQMENRKEYDIRALRPGEGR